MGIKVTESLAKDVRVERLSGFRIVRAASGVGEWVSLGSFGHHLFGVI